MAYLTRHVTKKLLKLKTVRKSLIEIAHHFYKRLVACQIFIKFILNYILTLYYHL